MMRQEKEFDGVEDIVEETQLKEEEENIKHKLNRNRNDNKKKNIVMYIIIGVLVLLLVGLIIYILLGDRNSVNDVDDDNDNEVVNVNVEEPIEEHSNIGYVSCDDNTALLNVRNSTSGSIIDGLSCYKEVVILEELEGTDVCDNWYKISYDKDGNNYTGYACGTYIKKLEVNSSVIKDIKKLVDKANEYYEGSVLSAYCGDNKGTKTIDFGNDMTGVYVKSQYKTLGELKNYLLAFMDEDLIDIELELSDINNPKYYDNYYEIDGNLYCRNYAGKGWVSYYTGNYDIEVTSYSDNKITLNIAYQYIDDESDCKLETISSCNRNDFVYDIGKVTIENNIITKMDFHK